MMVPPKTFHVRRPNPMSNAERQRRFREDHPGYYARLQAQRRGPLKAARAKIKAMQAELFAAELAAAAAKREPLLLPAPVEMIEIPGMNTIGAIPLREELAVLRKATASKSV